MQFMKYAAVGVVNTIAHWLTFWLLYGSLTDSQAVCNFLAFTVAVTLSFFLNAKWTFGRQPTGGRYLLFVLFMGSIASLVGLLADIVGLMPLVTLVGFAAISLLVGYLYSRYFVFAE